MYENCPKRLGNFASDVKFWSVPTEGSTDYFNACSTAMGTPKNFNGEQAAEFGQGYAGLYLYAPDDYREYLQAELTETLEEGREYQISFYVSLAERSDFAVKEFGVLFAKDRLDIPTKKELSKRHWYRQKGNSYNYMEIGYNNFYSDTQDWIEVSTRFIAKGTERFMVLGNFENNARTRKFVTKRNARQGAYYYVDRVEVVSVESINRPSTEKRNNPENSEIPMVTIADGEQATIIETESDTLNNSDENNFALNTIHTFQNIHFSFDRYMILGTEKLELQRVSDYLEAHPELGITINGHTDSMGTADYNKRLSAKRAKAVADFLIEIGISRHRISWEGHGNSNPVATNDTEKGRRKNRRVEFVISNLNTP